LLLLWLVWGVLVGKGHHLHEPLLLLLWGLVGVENVWDVGVFGVLGGVWVLGGVGVGVGILGGVGVGVGILGGVGILVLHLQVVGVLILKVELVLHLELVLFVLQNATAVAVRATFLGIVTEIVVVVVIVIVVVVVALVLELIRNELVLQIRNLILILVSDIVFLLQKFHHLHRQFLIKLSLRFVKRLRRLLQSIIQITLLSPQPLNLFAIPLDHPLRTH
jgi:hypothetical protein